MELIFADEYYDSPDYKEGAFSKDLKNILQQHPFLIFLQFAFRSQKKNFITRTISPDFCATSN